MSSSDLDALFAEASALYDRNELTAAGAGFERVLADDPAHIQARYKLGNVLKEQDRLDEASVQYRAVLGRNPRHAESLNNLGAIYQAQDMPDAAETCYCQAIAYKPELVPPYVNLGRIMQGQGRHEEAALIYRGALQRGLDAELFGHLLAALSGDGGRSGARAPAGYVRETFDAFAAGFERRVVGELGYRVPGLLAALVRSHGRPGLDVLDLGCGTGLVGTALGPLAGSLVGVDLSPRMLEEAARKGCYTALHDADIAPWLAQAGPASFDLVVAADVFIYIGDLQGIFQEVRRLLRPGGLFAFSVEICAEADFQLQPTGRYAQSRAYVEGLAAGHGLMLLAREAADVRSGIEGDLYLLGS
jgi:predicted TPR repeat methyltransferase